MLSNAWLPQRTADDHGKIMNIITKLQNAFSAL